MKYTKGPWTYRVNPDISDQWRSSHWIDGPKPHTQPICEVRNYQKLGENNAPLIAAAPDMYEALKALQASPDLESCHVLAMKAIMKAEGR